MAPVFGPEWFPFSPSIELVLDLPFLSILCRGFDVVRMKGEHQLSDSNETTRNDAVI